MQKNILRLQDLGQSAFWQIIQDVVVIKPDADDVNNTYSLDACAKIFENKSLHVWLGGENSKECACIMEYLNKFNLPFNVHDCSKMDTQSLESAAQTQAGNAIHVACGFSETQLYVLSKDAPDDGSVRWFNAISEHTAIFQAMSEIAFLFEHCRKLSVSMDTFRICWLGVISPLAQSIMTACLYAPFELFMGIPPWGDPEYMSTDLALKGGAKIFMTREPRFALDDAHFIYMDRELEKLAAENAQGKEKSQKLIPLGGVDEDYDWQQGLYLNEKYLGYATAAAPFVYIDIQESDAQNEMQERRKFLQEQMFLALLQHVSTVE